MSANPEKEVSLRPILPRNLTAKADYLVPGNPMIARPESGVGNAHPGLEFDVRALERHFFPGLVFDFQFGVGARLVSASAELLRQSGFSQDDISAGIFLWIVSGRFGDKPAEEQTIPLLHVDGYMVLRRIMDLEIGPLSVIVGRMPQTEAETAEFTRLASGGDAAFSVRTEGRTLFAVFTADRTRYLQNDGVIDTDLMPPGEITRNLCSPWQWDFADCYCYYWASSKPDVVIGISGDAQILNFQRDRDAREPERPPADSQSWRANNMTEPEMITDWTDLPVVTSERENAVPRVPRWPAIDERRLTLAQIADELPNLASLEHALCVEYLYAKFSIHAPRRAPWRMRQAAVSRYRSAREVFGIAVDEMRHFRWVNELLMILGREPSLGRASVIGQDLKRFFELRPLLPSVLDEFIGIEAPSSVFNDDPQQLDGMYTRILVSLHYLEGELGADRATRLMQLVKAIIDEGQSHWGRFRRIKETLQGQKPNQYLRFIAAPSDATEEPWRTVQLLCDRYYDLLLHCLYITFKLGRDSRGTWLDISHAAMFALDDAGFLLSEARFAPQFRLPAWTVTSVPPIFAPRHATGRVARFRDLIEDEAAIDQLFQPLLSDLNRLATSARREPRELAAKHRASIAVMQKKMRDALDGKRPG